MLRIVLHVTGSELRAKDKIHTTIGELVVALSDGAFEVCAEKRDAYFLVASALKHLLRRTQRDEAADTPKGIPPLLERY